jgi:hypothetical protein
MITDCDAPNYGIVTACDKHGIGFVRPLDVRWVSVGRRIASSCAHCRQAIPPVMGYEFTLANGKVENYFLGQCQRCHTIYWARR